MAWDTAHTAHRACTAVNRSQTANLAQGQTCTSTGQFRGLVPVVSPSPLPMSKPDDEFGKTCKCAGKFRGLMPVFTPDLLPVLKKDDEAMPAIANRITSSSLRDPPMLTRTCAGHSRDLMPLVRPSFCLYQRRTKGTLQANRQSVPIRLPGGTNAGSYVSGFRSL